MSSRLASDWTRRVGRVVGTAARARRQIHQVAKTYSSSYDLKSMMIDDVTGLPAKVSYIDEAPHSEIELSPPLVIIGGTAQTINTFTPHIQGLRRKRRLIILELRGQGTTELDSSFCNMPQLLDDMSVILRKLSISEMHLCGFSFGGRVALTFAAKNPTLVRKLSVTGVPLVRPPLGNLIVQSWADALSRDNFKECAWSFVLNGYSNAFINKYHNKLPTFISFVMKSNKIHNLQNLIRFSHQDFGSEYSMETSARAVRCPVQVIAGTEDRIAGYEETVALSRAISRCQLVTMKTGHLAPFEDTNQWRHELLRFLDGPIAGEHS